jgi:hypothetical protein
MTLTTLNTPALTTATACSSADTGVGATIAAGSQRWNGINAALPMPNMHSAEQAGQRAVAELAGQDAAGREVGGAGENQMNTSAGSRKTIDVPISMPRYTRPPRRPCRCRGG